MACARRIEGLVRTYGFKAVALTRGSSGSLIFQDGCWSELPPQSVQVVDTVGAGDAFAAALTMGLLARMTLEEMHVIAGEIARYICSQRGATPTLPEVFRRKFQQAASPVH